MYFADFKKAFWGFAMFMSSIRVYIPGLPDTVSGVSETSFRFYAKRWISLYKDFCKFKTNEHTQVIALKAGLYRLAPYMTTRHLIEVWQVMFQYPPSYYDVFTAAFFAAATRREVRRKKKYSVTLMYDILLEDIHPLVRRAKRTVLIYKRSKQLLTS